jgi:tRNA-Thr(GGU) m(6)t(6)A37 methyltransferase TsaA
VNIEPIGYVRSSRKEARDDDWGKVTARITLDDRQFSPEALAGVDEFSHLEVVFFFHEVEEEEIERRARHPRGNRSWPRVGIFAQRARMRPNRLAVSVCRLLSVDGLTLTVEALDAIDGTPVLDIKPYMTGFAPRGEVTEPAWAKELMASYWDAPGPA